jgi:hypothetical protein
MKAVRPRLRLFMRAPRWNLQFGTAIRHSPILKK